MSYAICHKWMTCKDGYGLSIHARPTSYLIQVVRKLVPGGGFWDRCRDSFWRDYTFLTPDGRPDPFPGLVIRIITKR